MHSTMRLLLRWQIIFVSFVTFIAQANTALSDSQDVLAIVMVVWNAKEDVCKALDPYVQAGVRSFLVCNVDYEWDTDDTLQRVQEFFDRHHIVNYHLMHVPFEPASTVFNHALDAAEATFPQATFLLMHDRVNRYLQNVSHLQQFCKEEQQSNQPCYLMLSVFPDYSGCQQHTFWGGGLIRAHTGIRYQGDEYEYIALDVPWQKVPADIFFTEHVSFEEGLQAYTENRKNKKIACRLAAYEKNPTNVWAVLSLAFTYKEYDDLERSEYYYRLYEQLKIVPLHT